MEVKLASMNLKSPGLKSALPGSPTTRNFSGSRMSMGVESLNNYLSPDSANNLSSNSGSDPATTLAQQRAKLKAAHRISAPSLASTIGDRNAWGSGSNQLGQVDERSSSPSQEITIPTNNNNSASRPKSTDFSGAANAFPSPRPDADGLSPMVGGSWASNVNTPLIPMFANKDRGQNQSLDAVAAKLNDFAISGNAGVPLMSDPPKRINRLSKGNTSLNNNNNHNDNQHHGVYGEDGNLLSSSGPHQGGGHHQGPQHPQRNAPGGFRNVNANNANAFAGQGGWNGGRSPALSNTSGRYGDDGSGNLNGLGMGGFGVGVGNGLGMGIPGGLNMAALAAAGMGQMSPFNNMFTNLAAMGLSPEQIMAMQMAAAAGQLGQGGLGAFGLGMQAQPSPSARSGRTSVRSPGVKSPSVRDGKKDEEDVDPKLLEDIPAWLRSLRLHKYTPNFEGMNWRDMVMMDEAALEGKGVAALGARRKMLKTFEIVRKKMGLEGGLNSAGLPSAGAGQAAEAPGSAPGNWRNE